MAAGSWLGILRRRWPLVAVLLVLDAVVAGYLYRRSHQAVGYQACTSLYVSDVTAPSITAGPSGATDLLLAGETAANFFADDVLDIARSGGMAALLSHQLASRPLASIATADINGAISGSRLDRTVSLCATNPSSASAIAVARQLATDVIHQRARFMGAKLARRTFVSMIAPVTVGPAPASRQRLDLLLRLALGALVAVGAALLWEAADPTVRSSDDLRALSNLSVLGEFRGV